MNIDTATDNLHAAGNRLLAELARLSTLLADTIAPDEVIEDRVLVPAVLLSQDLQDRADDLLDVMLDGGVGNYPLEPRFALNVVCAHMDLSSELSARSFFARRNEQPKRVISPEALETVTWWSLQLEKTFEMLANSVVVQVVPAQPVHLGSGT